MTPWKIKNWKVIQSSYAMLVLARSFWPFHDFCGVFEESFCKELEERYWKKTLPFPGLFAISPFFFGEIPSGANHRFIGVFHTCLYRDLLPRLGWLVDLVLFPSRKRRGEYWTNIRYRNIYIWHLFWFNGCLTYVRYIVYLIYFIYPIYSSHFVGFIDFIVCIKNQSFHWSH